MARYEIKDNTQFNSKEVYFSEKPADNVRLALKRLKMRWNPTKHCWYGYASEHELMAAILDSSPEEDNATVYTDGYMGGGAVYGSKSNKALYGADLSAAIRADIKAAGIKGVTVKCKSYSGGQSITATIKATPNMFVSPAEFVANYRIKGSGWIYTEDTPAGLWADNYWGLPADQREAIRQAAARYEYNRYLTREESINQYHIDKYTVFSDSGIKKLRAVNDIIKAYRYDESNSMVDYFNTNFCYNICTKPVTA